MTLAGLWSAGSLFKTLANPRSLAEAVAKVSGTFDNI